MAGWIGCKETPSFSLMLEFENPEDKSLLTHLELYGSTAAELSCAQWIQDASALVGEPGVHLSFDYPPRDPLVMPDMARERALFYAEGQNAQATRFLRGCTQLEGKPQGNRVTLTLQRTNPVDAPPPPPPPPPPPSPPGGCSTGAPCDDGNPCTLDTCLGDGVCTHQAMAWCAGYRKSISIDRTKVSPKAQTDLIDFPVLIALPADPQLQHVSSAGHVQSTSGHDILFFEADGTTRLDHQIELYVPTTGQLVAWVRLPLLSPSADTEFAIVYGNPALTTSRQNPAGVFSSRFTAVWHLGDDPGGPAAQIVDSLGNHHGTTSGTMASLNRMPAQIGNGLYLDGVEDWVSFGPQPGASAELTVALWLKPDQQTTSIPLDKLPNDSSGNGWALKLTGTGAVRYLVGSNGSHTNISPNQSYTTNAWLYAVLTYASGFGMVNFFSLNAGSMIGNSTNGNTTQNDTIPLRLGIPSAVDTADKFAGLIDEVQVSDIVRSQDWIVTCWSNQRDPGQFFFIGPEQPAP